MIGTEVGTLISEYGNIVGTLISKISRCPTRKKLRVSCYLRVEAGRAAEELAAAEEDLAAEAARLRDGLPAPVELGVLHQGQDSVDQSEL